MFRITKNVEKMWKTWKNGKKISTIEENLNNLSFFESKSDHVCHFAMKFSFLTVYNDIYQFVN